MFTGMIRQVGKVESIRTVSRTRLVTYSAPEITSGMKIGDSVAVDGVCQTVVDFNRRGFSSQALEATLSKTTFGLFRRGTVVNLEKALIMGDSLDGHIVQGHVSGTGRILNLKRVGENRFLRIALTEALLRDCIPEGSLAVDGISLTIAELGVGEAVLNIIPTTWEDTTLKTKSPGGLVNIETDPLTRRIGSGEKNKFITVERLTQWGY
ncbi:MAG: riboflavin synthase [Spirochaetales bacterium]|nr:riboflavin synthase [Spirochaetales bacterium]